MTEEVDHAVVLGDLRFPVSAEAPHAAREMVGLIFDVWSIADPHTAQLCVSELASNVFNHARIHGSHMRVMVRQRDDKIRIEVYDASAGEPEMNADTSIRESGNGLFLVDALSSNWGFQFIPSGKVVWCELLLMA